MDIYLDLLETGDSLQFPLLPESIETNIGNQFASYQILGQGEIRVPSGQSLDEISWKGIFPGECRQISPYIRQWIAPLDAYGFLQNVKSQAGTSKKCRLLITETAVNIDVYLTKLSGEYVGGQGDFFYEISFVQAKDLRVSTTSEATVERPEPPASTTYTVVKGDCLWNIAQRLLGDGSRYGEIYAANQGLIDGQNGGSSKLIIYPGQVFTIPSS